MMNLVRRPLMGPVAMTLIGFGLIAALVGIVSLFQSDRGQTARVAELEQRLVAREAAAAALAKQVEGLGADPVVEPTDPLSVTIPALPPAPIPGPAGRDGADGKDGADGEDSVVPGPAGEPGSPGVAGEPGSPGRDGVDGAAGRDGVSVTDVECDDETGRWRVTYSDGVVDEDAGTCRNPTPSPEPSGDPGPVG